MTISADCSRLRVHVEALEGVRHPRAAPAALRAAEAYIAGAMVALDLEVTRHAFTHAGSAHHNVVGLRRGADPARPRVLVGAHFDTVPGSPGADDNASGVAAMLEVARGLGPEPLPADVQFAGFNLEEPQGYTYRVGSRRFARDARAAGARYAGALILEMVGFTRVEPGTQNVPALLFWKRVPSTGMFLAATGDGQSRRLLRDFERAARSAVPALEVVTFRTPFRGWLVTQTRLSDNASFWDVGYPALMITDTAFLRNPYYHTGGDRAETLDYGFMARVTDAVVAAVRALAGRAQTAAEREALDEA